jgi:hypothetical protein
MKKMAKMTMWHVLKINSCYIINGDNGGFISKK